MLKIGELLRAQPAECRADIITFYMWTRRAGTLTFLEMHFSPSWEYHIQCDVWSKGILSIWVQAPLKWESNALISAKSKAAHFKASGSVGSHTKSQQQRGSSLPTPAFLLCRDCSGSFSRNLRWTGGDGVQVVSRTSRHRLGAAPSHAQVSIRVVKWIMGKRFPASLHLGLLLIGHVLFM